jgi:hypothetical protein
MKKGIVSNNNHFTGKKKSPIKGTSKKKKPKVKRKHKNKYEQRKEVIK